MDAPSGPFLLLIFLAILAPIFLVSLIPALILFFIAQKFQNPTKLIIKVVAVLLVILIVAFFTWWFF